MSRMFNHLWWKYRERGYNIGELQGFLATDDQFYEAAKIWVENQMWPNNLNYDSDDDECACEFFKKTNALHDLTRSSLQQQQRNDNVPTWEKAEVVPAELFDHVASQIITVTVKAFANTDISEDDDQQSAASDMYSFKAFSYLYQLFTVTVRQSCHASNLQSSLCIRLIRQKTD